MTTGDLIIIIVAILILIAIIIIAYYDLEKARALHKTLAAISGATAIASIIL